MILSPFSFLTNSATDSRKFRHEFKYEIDACQVAILQSRLPEIMQLDNHASNAGIYEVRSLYFDDFCNSCYYENENGTDPREKFRIRIYNGSSNNIHLELKRKEAGKTLKRSCTITRQQVDALLAGDIFPWDDNMDPLLKKFYIWIECRIGRPKVIVNYSRIPFICPDGNTRVTLDLNISSSADIHAFFNNSFYGRPIMPAGKHVLEVKFDDFLPDHISHSIQTNALHRITCSKYYLCRKFGGSL